MSMADLNRALELINGHPELAEFAGPRDLALLTLAEEVLGGKFPPTYRAFVESLGAGNFGAFEVYGVIDSDFDHSTVPDAVAVTLKDRSDNKLPDRYLVIGSTGYGPEYCIELSDNGESPVFVFKSGPPSIRQRIEDVARDFGEFLLAGVMEELSDQESDEA